MAKKATKTRVVEAAVSAGSAAALGGGISSKAIEDAMGQATMDALAQGVTDDKKILKLKLAARDRVVAEHSKAVAAAQKADAKR